MAKTSKLYAVAVGKQTGIFPTWAECEKQTKGFPGARFKSFSSRVEAEEFLAQYSATVTPSHDDEKPAKRMRQEPIINYRLKINVHFDGGARGNPGVAGAGVKMMATTEILPGSFQREIKEVRLFVGENATNNVAEYQGLVCGLRESQSAVNKFVRDFKGDGVQLLVNGDSDLIIQQLNGTYQCKSANLIPFYREAKSILTQMKQAAPMEVTFHHVYRKDNTDADALANEAMDTRKSWTTSSLETITADGDVLEKPASPSGDCAAGNEVVATDCRYV